MAQTPGYGWCLGQPGQTAYPGPGPAPGFGQQPINSMQQAYCPSMNQAPIPFIGAPNTTLGIGWQQGPTPNPVYGGFNSGSMQYSPMVSAPGVLGFGFDVPSAPAQSLSGPALSPMAPLAPSAPSLSPPQPQQRPLSPSAPSQPSAPSRLSTSNEYAPQPFVERPSADSASKVIEIKPNPKPDRPPTPEVPISIDPKPSSSNNSTTDTDGHRNTSQYKEALQNMAALMTDVDLTEDVMNDLKQRFDLK